MCDQDSFYYHTNGIKPTINQWPRDHFIILFSKYGIIVFMFHKMFYIETFVAN